MGRLQFTFGTVLAVAALAPSARAQPARPELEIRILFDNTAANKDYLRSWGFSALIDFRGKRILFDAGGDPILTLEHMDKMKIDAKTIDEAFISHVHDDHRRGIYWVFEKNPKMKVHFLDSFGIEAFKAADQVKMKPNRVKGPFELMPGVYSTGPIDGLPPEQALLLETSQGLVMIVGCSHPGIVKMVETAQKQRNKDSIRLLLGGFHLLKTEPEKIRQIVTRLDELKVKVVIPAHCTGDVATDMLQTTFGKHPAGAGRWIVMDGKRLELKTVPVNGESAAPKKDDASVPQPNDAQLRLAVAKNVMQLVKKLDQPDKTEMSIQMFFEKTRWERSLGSFQTLRASEIHLEAHAFVKSTMPGIMQKFMPRYVQAKIMAERKAKKAKGPPSAAEIERIRAEAKATMEPAMRMVIMPALEKLSAQRMEEIVKDEKTLTRAMAEQIIKAKLLPDGAVARFKAELDKAGYPESLIKGADPILNQRSHKMMEAIDLAAVAKKAGR